jgi:hypothetical protein
MQADKLELLSQLSNNLLYTYELFGNLLAVPKESVPVSVKNKAFLRRLSISFISIFELLNEKSNIPKEFREKKKLEEIADFFISKQVLSPDDKDSFVLFGNVYAAIRWATPGNEPNEEKIMEHVDALYAFMQRFVAHQASSIISDKSQETAL